MSDVERWSDELRSTAPEAYTGRIVCVDEAPSTMDLMRGTILDAPLSNREAALVLARRQTAGRGRQGRGWQHAEGALAVTFAFPILNSVAHLGGITLAIGVTVAETLEHLGIPVRLKWPNDLMVEAAPNRYLKVGGILVETEESAVLVGIGVNLSSSPNELNIGQGLGLGEIPPQRLAGMLSKPLVELVMRYQYTEPAGSGFKEFLSRWSRFSLLEGREITVRIGERVIEGTCRGVNENGALLVQTAESIEKVPAGHIERW